MSTSSIATIMMILTTAISFPAYAAKIDSNAHKDAEEVRASLIRLESDDSIYHNSRGA